MSVRLADYVISYLAEYGVRDVFTVTGGGCIFMCDAVGQHKQINYYCCHHEQAVAMATEAYARVKRTLGVSLVTVGPGATNAITGVAGSWMDSVPHLVLSGQAFLNHTIGNSGLRQLGVQEINIIDLVKPMTKYAVMVEDPKTIRYHLEKAIHLATTGRPGPVWLDLPANVQNAKIDPGELEGFKPERNELGLTSNLKEQVSKVVSLLKSAKRPLFHIGQGAKIARVEDRIVELLEKLSIPFVTARNANDIVSSDHELCVGRPGTFAQRGANFAVQNSDLYIALGTRLNLPQTGYNSKDYARNAKKVMVDIDQAELNKSTLSIDLPIHADLKDFVAELERQLQDISVELSAWVNQCQEWKERYPVVLPEYVEHKGSINSYYFTEVLSEILGAKDVIVTDMGIAFQGTHQAFKVKKGQHFFTNCGFAAMGWGLPAAVGACIAADRARTVCIAGDGGFLMNIQELATVMHHKLPVKIFILNNGGYLTIKQTQQLGFEGRLMGVDGETGLSFPDFLKIADAHNISSVRLDSHAGLKEKMQAFLNSSGPGLCEIIMDHDQQQMPKAINRRNADGTMSPTALEDMYPYLDKAELKENMIAEKETK